MIKDPAFLFYSSDFITGTITMTDEEIGMYVRLLCVQHQTCHLDAKAMQKLCGGIVPPAVLAKFKVDDEGKFYNERLENEMLERKEKGKKNKKNAEVRWDKVRNANAYANEHAKSMPFTENVNEDEIESDLQEKKGAIEKIETPPHAQSDPAFNYNPEVLPQIAENIYELTRYINSKTGGSLDPMHHAYCSVIWRRVQEGRSFEELRLVVDIKVEQWLHDDKMRGNLVPTTLFSESLFDKYLNEARMPKIEKNASGHNSTSPRKLVFDKP